MLLKDSKTNSSHISAGQEGWLACWNLCLSGPLHRGHKTAGTNMALHWSSQPSVASLNEKREGGKNISSHCVAAWETPQEILSLGTGTKRWKTTETEKNFNSGLWCQDLLLLSSVTSAVPEAYIHRQTLYTRLLTQETTSWLHWISHWRMIPGELKQRRSSADAEAESGILLHFAFSLSGQKSFYRDTPQCQKGCITCWLRFQRNGKDLRVSGQTI